MTWSRARWLAAPLTLLALSACGAPSTPRAPAGTACVNAGAPHRAYVVVMHLDGRTIQRCVGFTGAQMTGDVLMRESGVDTQAMQMSWGRQMCEVDGEPPPGTPCSGGGRPRWVMFVWARGWQPAEGALAQTILTDGQGLGWRYLVGDPMPPPPPEITHA